MDDRASYGDASLLASRSEVLIEEVDGVEIVRGGEGLS